VLIVILIVARGFFTWDSSTTASRRTKEHKSFITSRIRLISYSNFGKNTHNILYCVITKTKVVSPPWR
jgi:hypothetical protein